jgi:hypothetical protein
MNVSAVGPFTIEDQSAADEYLEALFENPEYRSMHEVRLRAAEYIRDKRVRDYFIEKAKARLETLR